MSRISLLAWLPFALLPAACTPAADQPSRRKSPVEEARPSEGTVSDEAPAELSCGRAAPVAPTVTHLDGPSEAVPRLVAATDRHFFVGTGSTLRRGSRGDDIELLVAMPRSPVVTLAATSTELFVVTYDGVLRSDDEGESFSPADDGLSAPVSELRVSGDALIATDSRGAIFSWSKPSSSWVRIAMADVTASLAASDGVTTLADTGSAVLRSAVGTHRWEPAAGLEAWGYRDLAIRGSDSLAVTSAGEIRFSGDAGATFSVASPETLALGSAGRVAFGEGFAIAATASGFTRSSDHGRSWSLALSAPDADVMSGLAVRGTRLVTSTTDVRLSEDGGAHFSSPLALGDASVVSLAQVGGWLYASTADFRVQASHDGGKHWFDAGADGYVVSKGDRDGDATYLLLSQSLDASVFASQALVRSSDGGATFTPLVGPANAGLTSFGAFSASEGRLLLGATIDLASPYDPSGPRGGGVFGSSDGGATWERASDGLPSKPNLHGESYPGVIALESFGGSTIALLASEPPYRSVDGGDSWERIDSGLPLAATRSLDHLVAHDGLMFASSRASGVGLYRFDEAYGAWVPLTASGLPEAFGVEALEENGGLLFAAVEGPGGAGRGLYVSSDEGQSFALLSTETVSRSLLVVGDALFAGTTDEGLFRLPIPKCEPR